MGRDPMRSSDEQLRRRGTSGGTRASAGPRQAAVRRPSRPVSRVPTYDRAFRIAAMSGPPRTRRLSAVT
jgi:hypothetical protein